MKNNSTFWRNLFHLLFFCSLFVALPLTALSAEVTLEWDPSSSAAVTGYRIHYGTRSGNHTQTLDAGLHTSFKVPNLNQGTTYYFAVTAYSSDGESGFSNEVSKTFAQVDSGPPTLYLLQPTTELIFTSNSPSLNLSGSASDDTGVTQVSWANNRGGSGNATGTSSWQIDNINLSEGVNELVLNATDSAGKIGSLRLTVLYSSTGVIAFQQGSTEPFYSWLEAESSNLNAMIVKVDKADIYTIWGRVRNLSPASATFSVTMDAELEGSTWDITPTTELYWSRITTSGSARLFSLTAGTHNLKISADNPDLQLYRILITNAIDFIPSESNPDNVPPAPIKTLRLKQ